MRRWNIQIGSHPCSEFAIHVVFSEVSEYANLGEYIFQCMESIRGISRCSIQLSTSCGCKEVWSTKIRRFGICSRGLCGWSLFWLFSVEYWCFLPDRIAFVLFYIKEKRAFFLQTETGMLLLEIIFMFISSLISPGYCVDMEGERDVESTSLLSKPDIPSKGVTCPSCSIKRPLRSCHCIAYVIFLVLSFLYG